MTLSSKDFVTFTISISLLDIFLLLVKVFDGIQTAAHIAQKKICECKCSHGFNYHHGAGNDDRIMSSLDRNLNLFLIYIYRGLRAGNGRRRLDGSAYDQLGACR